MKFINGFDLRKGLINRSVFYISINRQELRTHGGFRKLFNNLRALVSMRSLRGETIVISIAPQKPL